MIAIIVPNPYTLPTLDFVGGSTQILSFSLYFRVEGVPFDASECEAEFAIVNINNKKSTLLRKAMVIEPGSDETDGEAAENVISVTLDPADTVELDGKYIYQITIKDGYGGVDIPNQGIMFITNNIDKNYIR